MAGSEWIDLDVIEQTSRDFCRRRLVKLCSMVNERRALLEEGWDAFERRFGPDRDLTLRADVLRALGRER